MMLVAKQRAAFVFLGVKIPRPNVVLANHYNASSAPTYRKGCSVLCLAASTGNPIRAWALCFLPAFSGLPESTSKEITDMLQARKDYVKMSWGSGWLPEMHAKNNWRCWYCGIDVKKNIKNHSKQQATADHLNPLDRGGTNDESNLVTACSYCNKNKNTKTLEEYRLYVSLKKFQGGILLDARYVFHRLIRILPSPFKERVQSLLQEFESEVPKIRFYGEQVRQQDC